MRFETFVGRACRAIAVGAAVGVATTGAGHRRWVDAIRRRPGPPAPPRRSIARTGAVVGGVFGLGFALSRPLLPRQPEIAGATYGAALGLAAWRGAFAARRALGGSRPPGPPVSAVARRLAGWVVLGVLVAQSDRALQR